MPRYDNVLAAIGNTPLVRLNRLAPAGVNVYAKLESLNPMGSVKDRMALAIIERAEHTGALKPGQTVIEATSGNTGIGLAMVCAQKGYPLVVTMAESFSVERRKLLRFLGAKVVLTPASEKGSGMFAKAVELAEAHGYFLCRQFENEANADVHSRTTAVEILQDLEGDGLDCFVTGFGTGGTLLGVARTLKRQDPGIRIVAAEPDNAQVLGSGIPQERDESGRPAGSHPNFRPHLMQGWSPDFVSHLTEQAQRERLVDEVTPVSGSEAMKLCHLLAREEGIFVGTSSGATLAAALAVARRSPAGANIVCMLPDTGERYQSTPLFDGIEESMNGEEMALSQSTPSCRFDVRQQPAAARSRVAAADLDIEAADLVGRSIDESPVVMFALEWCEFCWSVRKLFARLGIEYTSIDLDSVAYQRDNLGSEMRTVLEQRTGSPTIPQIFIAGRLMGGATDLFDAMRSGSMQRLLEEHDIDFDDGRQFDPYELLPRWLQPRQLA